MIRGRLEAFSDGVIAIILTIMVLELKAPKSADIDSLVPLAPVFGGYVLSFIYVGIYWNNHHHLFQAVESVNGKVLLANLHLLFWLSLVPFTTSWMGNSMFAYWPVVVYGVVLLLAGSAYYILSQTLIRHHGRESTLATSIANDFKGKLSLALYAVAILVAALSPWLSCFIYAAVAAIWLIPDRRLENGLSRDDRNSAG